MMEGCKNTFDFSVEMALISFVYKGIGSKFCLRLPVSKKNTVESFLKVHQKLWPTLGLCSCIWERSQLPIICSNYLQPPVACGSLILSGRRIVHLLGYQLSVYIYRSFFKSKCI